mmetsp:Transcript_5407/g.15910  ORF Transcript_5407/g.15910 Transcript_5407/m.15910 type:complete len:86 (+) Transcript_5407:164-421(+)
MGGGHVHPAPLPARPETRHPIRRLVRWQSLAGAQMCVHAFVYCHHDPPPTKEWDERGRGLRTRSSPGVLLPIGDAIDGEDESILE